MLAQLFHVQVAPAGQPLLACSTAKAVTNRRHASRLGKILTTLLRRFIS